MNLWASIPLAGCIVFSILCGVVLQQAKTRVDRLFTLFLFASAVWSFCEFMLVYDLSASKESLIFWNGLVVAAIPWIAVSYYHFIRAYDNKRGGIGVLIGYLFVIGILFLNLKGYIVKDAYFFHGALLHDIGHWDLILAAAILPFLGLIIAMLIRRYRWTDDAIDRNKTAYLMTGWIVLVTLSYINPFTPALRGYPIDHIGNLANALIITYTISHYSLLDIRFVLRRGLAFVLALIPIAALYVGGLFALFQFYPKMPLTAILLIILGLTVLLALVSVPLRRPIQNMVDRVFYRETYQHRQTLLSFTSNMGNILNLEQLTRELLQTLSKAIHISQAALLFEDPGGNVFRVRSVYPELNGQQNYEFNLSFDSPVVVWLQNENHILTMKQIETAPQFKALWDSERESLHNSHLELLCPLKSHGKLVGILGLSKKNARQIFSQEDIELVMSVANQAGVIVENAQLYSQAMTWAITDGLTRLYNHRYMHECLDKEIVRGTRLGTTFSIIMIDLDFFKTFNDTYGHLAGDEVLTSIGRCIQSSIRTMDMAFRYGGEEFAVIMPETMTEGAFEAAERIREKIEQKVFNGRTSITASLGIATWPTDGVTKEQILVSADKALYAAKGMGRNRTCPPYALKKRGLIVLDQVSETQQVALSMIFAMAATMETKDHYTYGHSRNVSQYAVAMAQALHLSTGQIDSIRTAGLLHDIGKMRIPDLILNKDGVPDEQEWDQIKNHPEKGVEILKIVAELTDSLPIILNHHEHFDGSGYPAGKKGQDIPLEARLISIADAYDAMTSLRPYHNQKSSKEAIDELRRCAGTTFDPELVELFCGIILAANTKQAQENETTDKNTGV